MSYNVRDISGAFYECSSLKEINIPNSIKIIGQYAFYRCSSLERVNFPNSLEAIGGNAFECCISLNEINLPNSVLTIGWKAFNGCSSLVHIDIPEGVRDIHYKAFTNCKNLISISLPSTLESYNYIYGEWDSYKCDYVSYIYIKAIVPPKFAYARFSFNTPEIIVPEQALKAYQSSSWSSDERGIINKIIGVDTETFDFKEYLKKQGVYE